MSEVTEVKAAAETAVATEAVAVESKVVAYVRANALKAIGIASVLGAVIGKFVI